MKLLNRLLPPKKSRSVLQQERLARLKAKAEEGDRKALLAQQITEAQFYAQMIPAALARMNIASITKEKNKLKVNRVKIRPPVLIHEDYYMLEINTGRLPRGVKIQQLQDPETIQTLSAACRTPVEVQFTPAHGFWYVVPRRGGLGIIPKMITYDDVMALMPQSAPRWSFPIGVGENKRLVWVDLRKTPHLIMVGSTGMGKSVFLKSLLLTLANQISPNHIRLIIADFKMGPDFRPLVNLPHLGLPGEDGKFSQIITEPDGLIPLLSWARDEIDRRNQRFAEFDDITNIDQYNSRHRKSPMPHIVLLLDEIPVAMLELPKREQTPIKQLLSGISRLGRSPGIHIILGSQSAGADILDGATGQNIAARVVGYCTGPQSQVALGSWSASKIPPFPGRAMWREGMQEYELQLPFVSPQQAVELVDRAINAWVDGQDQDDLAIEIFRWCLADLDGDYDMDRVYRHFNKEQGVPRSDVEIIGREYELTTQEDGSLGPTFDLDGQTYVLVPGIPGRRPRRVVSKERYDEIMNRANEPTPEPEPTGPAHDVTPDELFRYAIEHNRGQFSRDHIYKAFQARGITKAEVLEISQRFEGQVIEIDGQAYILEPGAGRKPRQLVAYRLPSGSQAPTVPDSSFRGETQTSETWELPPDPPDLAIGDDLLDGPEAEPDSRRVRLPGPDLITVTELPETDPASEDQDSTPDWLRPASEGGEV